VTHTFTVHRSSKVRRKHNGVRHLQNLYPPVMIKLENVIRAGKAFWLVRNV
jgi:hypothetical protein